MLSYYVAGSPENPLVILSHGVEDCAVAWADYIDHLSDRYLVVAVDSLGHGFSPRFTADQLADPFEASYRAFEETVEAIERRFGATAVFVGHSMGGAQVTMLANRRPDLVRGAVVEDPAWLDDDQRRGFLDRAQDSTALLDGWAADPIDAMRGNMAKRPMWPLADHLGWTLGKNRADRALILTGVVSFAEPWRQVVEGIRVPLVVVSSDMEEDLVGVDGSRAAEAINPNVTAVLIPDAPHTLRRAAIDRFNEAIDPYLAAWSAWSA